MLYILSANKSLKSKAFLYSNAVELFKRVKRGSPKEAEFANYEKLKLKDRVMNVPSKPLKDQATLDNIIKEHEEGLKHPFYKAITDEITRVKEDAKKHGKKKRKFEWYSLFDGPNSIEQLAHSVNLPAVYEMFYRRYSGKIHPTDLVRGNVDIRPDFSGFQIKPVRRNGNPREITGISCHIAFLIFEAITIEYFNSELQDVRGWYEKEIKTSFFAVS